MQYLIRISTAVTITSLALVLVPTALAGEGARPGLAVRGVVTDVSDAGITVRGQERKLSCAVGEGSPSLAGISIGQRIGILCRRTDTGLVLVGLKKPEPKSNSTRRPKPVSGARKPEPKPENLEIEGVVGNSVAGSVTIQSRSGRALTCFVPDALASTLDGDGHGDAVKALCTRRGDAAPVLLRLKKLGDQSGRTPGSEASSDIRGVVSTVGRESITVANDTRSLTCKVNAETGPSVADLKVGAKIMVLRRNRVLVAIKPVDAPPLAGDDDDSTEAGEPEGKQEPEHATEPTPGQEQWAMTFAFRGPVASVSPDRIFVTTDGGSRSCLVPEALRPAVAGFAVGAVVKIVCSGEDLPHAKLVSIENG